MYTQQKRAVRVFVYGQMLLRTALYMLSSCNMPVVYMYMYVYIYI